MGMHFEPANARTLDAGHAKHSVISGILSKPQRGIHIQVLHPPLGEGWVFGKLLRTHPMAIDTRECHILREVRNVRRHQIQHACTGWQALPIQCRELPQKFVVGVRHESRTFVEVSVRLALDELAAVERGDATDWLAQGT